MSLAQELLDEAIWFTDSSPQQRAAFEAYKAMDSYDTIYDSMAFDTETTGLTFGVPAPLHTKGGDIWVDDICVFGTSLCFMVEDQLYLAWGRIGSDFFHECNDMVMHECPKVGHNVRYDWKTLANSGVKVESKVHDTLTMARLVWNRRMKFDLKALTKIVYPEGEGYEDELKAVHRNIKSSYTRAGYPKDYANYSFIPDDICGKYAMMDTFVTWLLHLRLMPDIVADHAKVYKREMRIVEVVKNIEMVGVPFNRRVARKEIVKLRNTLEPLKGRLEKMVGYEFNPNSPKQMQGVLFDLGVPKKLLTITVKGKKKVTTEKETLQKAVIKLNKPKVTKFVDTLFKLRSCKKMLGTYLEPLLKRAQYNNGIIYCGINPTDTRTGRMSSSNPNLQNIPRPDTGADEDGDNPVRKCFGCKPGYFNMYIDYAQMEMWLFAIIANEMRMLAALQQGADIHATVAYDIYGDEAFVDKGKECQILQQDFTLLDAIIDKVLRFKSKKVNFGILYGMGFRTLAVSIKSPEIEAYDLRRAYLDRYPRITEYNEELSDLLRMQGYVTGLFGKRYNIAYGNAYKAINALVQGGCAQILKIALWKIANYLNKLPSYGVKRIQMMLLIHDEIVFQVPNEAKADMPIILPKLINTMEEVPKLMRRNIRLKADPSYSTTSWDQKKGVPEQWLENLKN